jgi:hypothetical protein
MKTLFVALGLAFSFLSFTSFENKESLSTVSSLADKISADCRYGQCQATAKSTGKQCKHCVSNSGDKFCFQHK